VCCISMGVFLAAVDVLMKTVDFLSSAADD
jgi:hypothetical protein